MIARSCSANLWNGKLDRVSSAKTLTVYPRLTAPSFHSQPLLAIASWNVDKLKIYTMGKVFLAGSFAPIMRIG